MTERLNFDGPSEDLDVFECPNCKQTIDTSADTCRFCGAKVDHEAAQKAARLLARVDQACSDASVMRSAAGIALLVPVGVVLGCLRSHGFGRFVERVGFQNVLLGLCVLVLVVSWPFPIWSLLWWKKNANLASDDEDFQSGRRIVRTAGFVSAVSFATFGLILCLVFISKATSR